MARGSTKIDEQLALDLLLDHRSDFVREFLRENSLSVSGTKAELRRRLEAALEANTIGIAEIIEHLDDIEGWGNQHLYLYQSPEGLLRSWRAEASVKEILRRAKKISLMNAHLPLALPATTTLSRVAWSHERVRFVWITTRTWEERAEGDDQRDGARLWKAYNERSARGVLAFDWNLLSGDAMLSIERLPIGNNYEDARAALVKELTQFVDFNVFTPVEIGRAIQPIEKSSEVLNRSLALRSVRGTRVSFTSRVENATRSSEIPTHNAREKVLGTMWRAIPETSIGRRPVRSRMIFTRRSTREMGA